MPNVYKERDAVNLQDVLRRNLIVLESLAEEKGIEVEAQIVDAPLLVKGNPQKLGRVLNNLFSNAVKYNRAGGKITLVVGLENKNKVRVSVWLNRTVGWSVVC